MGVFIHVVKNQRNRPTNRSKPAANAKHLETMDNKNTYQNLKNFFDRETNESCLDFGMSWPKQ